MAARIVAGTLALGALVPVGAGAGPLISLGAPAVASASPETETVSEIRLREAQERLDDASARLAQARTAAESVGGEERKMLLRLEARIQAEKAGLVNRENALAREHERESAALAAVQSTYAATPASPVYSTAAVGYAPAGPTYAPSAVPGDDAWLASTLDAYLSSRGSPLTGLGAAFVAESRAVALDPRFLVAITGAETSFGTYGPSQLIQNPFGLGPGLSYPSWADAIRAAAQNLAGGYYVGEGRYTIAAIQQRWAPNGASNDPTGLNSNWTRNVSTYYAELGGNPLAPVFTNVAAPSQPVFTATVEG